VWETCEGQFVTLVCCNIAQISFDIRCAPYAHLSDGCVDLLIVRQCTRTEMFDLFSQMERGEYVNSSVFNGKKFLSYIKAKKFRLTPETQESLLGFDGERAPSQTPVTALNRRGLATLLG
jgi:sphingosine kinase